MIYGIIIILLEWRFVSQDNDSIEEEETFGHILIAVRSITIITATFSQMCEITSRLDEYDPKVAIIE